MDDKHTPKKIGLISFVFSFRNEEDTIPELIKRLRVVLADLQAKNKISGWEFIFVNDCSTDQSVAILLDHDKNHGDIKIITMSRVFGVAACVMAGFAYSQGDAVIYMDCDLQDPPELIPQMIAAWQDSDEMVDVVHTVREKREGESPLKLFITKIGYYILNRYSSVNIPCDAGDFKLLSRRMVNHILTMQESHPFIRGLVAYVGFKQVAVLYVRQARFAGKSKFFVLGKKVISNFLNSALVSFTSVPLEIASYCGIVAILVDFLLAIYFLIFQKMKGVAVPEWTILVVLIVFISAVQLLCLGAIGLYLRSVHEQTKMRPKYIVNSIYGFKNDKT